MLAAVVNMFAVLVGSAIGILFRRHIHEEHMNTVMAGLALCTAVIGVTSAVSTNNILIVIICMVLGTLIGELLRIDDRIENAGNYLKEKLVRGNRSESRFTEAFVSSSVLFCIGSMAITGSISAGIDHDYSIIFAKSAIDFASAIAFSAAMGVGVAFSALCVFLYQGALTLLAGAVGPYLSTAVITEMSAVGGTLLLGLAANMLNLCPSRIKVANMLPAIFLPIAYIPLADWLSGVLK